MQDLDSPTNFDPVRAPAPIVLDPVRTPAPIILDPVEPIDLDPPVEPIDLDPPVEPNTVPAPPTAVGNEVPFVTYLDRTKTRQKVV